jgi:hypothetical protein
MDLLNAGAELVLLASPIGFRDIEGDVRLVQPCLSGASLLSVPSSQGSNGRTIVLPIEKRMCWSSGEKASFKESRTSTIRSSG